jgi:membrane-bound ClpP family serine protease
MTNPDQRRPSLVADNTWKSIQVWRDRIRDPSLKILFVLELCAIFLATPLAANGLPVAQAVADMLLLAVLVIVVMLSQRWDAIIMILFGLAGIAASFLVNGKASPVLTAVLRRGGGILALSTLIWVVAHAVYAPGGVSHFTPFRVRS